ncbi:MAG: hypothetical protein GQ553_03470, partial [Nitrosomonadaceae bacterium]|nr:hypothetical protein [Nitrosomonadaceae bacterium]
KIMDELKQLIKNFEKRNNMSITVTIYGDGSGTVVEFWEEDELKEYSNTKELRSFLQDTQYELDEKGKCISPVTTV